MTSEPLSAEAAMLHGVMAGDARDVNARLRDCYDNELSNLKRDLHLFIGFIEQEEWRRALGGVREEYRTGYWHRPLVGVEWQYHTRGDQRA